MKLAKSFSGDKPWNTQCTCIERHVITNCRQTCRCRISFDSWYAHNSISGYRFFESVHSWPPASAGVPAASFLPFFFSIDDSIYRVIRVTYRWDDERWDQSFFLNSSGYYISDNLNLNFETKRKEIDGRFNLLLLLFYFNWFCFAEKEKEKSIRYLIKVVIFFWNRFFKRC